ncbi:hypothetical protein PR048_032663 [Dryococelus australis]|uniref:Transposable element P transposase-like RNase H domain-containing protein n=1 Tax=Dryococelus australis TaxID=614101 RepID=A0ABQ9G5T9_9NEOP|nr:hypothetical protein PR048_032663 [Dryococelus australis]
MATHIADGIPARAPGFMEACTITKYGCRYRVISAQRNSRKRQAMWLGADSRSAVRCLCSGPPMSPALLLHAITLDLKKKKTEIFRKNGSLCVQEMINLTTIPARICFGHFTDDDYQRYLRAELMEEERKRLLKPEAFPNKNLPNKKETVDGARSERLQRRSIKRKLVDELITTKPKQPRPSDNETEEIDLLKFSILTLEKQLEARKENELRLRKQNEVLKSLSLALKFAHGRCKVIRNIFTPKQTEKPLNNSKRKVWWENGDIAAAITLRSVSRKACSYLRKKAGILLPGLSPLRKWTRNVKCAPGVLEEVLTLLRATSQATTLSERLAVLSLDEMQIDGRYCYDQTADRIFRPCKNVQVLMARGLASKWKRPIFYDFDTEVTRDLLSLVIKKLEERGFIVVAVVSDIGGSNQCLWKSLSINAWVFAGVPHLIKLPRNNFLDYGIQLRNGTVIRKEHISNIIED